jgi:hypothetical protein
VLAAEMFQGISIVSESDMRPALGGNPAINDFVHRRIIGFAIRPDPSVELDCSGHLFLHNLEKVVFVRHPLRGQERPGSNIEIYVAGAVTGIVQIQKQIQPVRLGQSG